VARHQSCGALGVGRPVSRGSEPTSRCSTVELHQSPRVLVPSTKLDTYLTLYAGRADAAVLRSGTRQRRCCVFQIAGGQRERDGRVF